MHHNLCDQKRNTQDKASLSISDLAVVCHKKEISESFPSIQKWFRFMMRLLFLSSNGKGALAICPLVSVKPLTLLFPGRMLKLNLSKHQILTSVTQSIFLHTADHTAISTVGTTFNAKLLHTCIISLVI